MNKVDRRIKTLSAGGFVLAIVVLICLTILCLAVTYRLTIWIVG